MGGHGSTLLRSPFTRAFHEENSWLTACSSQIFGFIVAFTLRSHCLLVPPSQWLSTAGNWSQTISDQHRTLLIGNLCWGTGGPKFLRAAQQTKALLPNPLPSSPPFTGIGSTLQSKSSLLPPPAPCPPCASLVSLDKSACPILFLYLLHGKSKGTLVMIFSS